MRSRIIIGVGVIAAFAIGFMAIFALTSALVQPVVDAGDEFFTAMRDDDWSEAYTHFSESFTTVVNEGDFRLSVDAFDFTDWSYSERQLKNNEGILRGTVLVDGENRAFELRLMPEEDTWRISYFEINTVTTGE